MTRVTILTGGVGGAKLVEGMVDLLGGAAVTAIVNTGDDFTHLGLAISPDIDTLVYTLAGLSDPVRGWGRRDEGWRFMDALRSLGGEDWFNLGDADLALHVWRTARLAAGGGLSAVTAAAARQWGIAARILPMSEDPVATVIDSDEGALPFQRYFVGRRCEPLARAIRFEGAAEALPAPGVLAAITDSDIDAIIIAPSNPLLSVDPILAVPGIREALRATTVPVVAVSPLIGGRAVKGPTAKLFAELGQAADNGTIARHYAGIADALLIDGADAGDAVGMPVGITDTLMTGLEDKRRVAEAALALAQSLRR